MPKSTSDCEKLIEFNVPSDVSTFYDQHPRWQLHFVVDSIAGMSAVTLPTTLY